MKDVRITELDYTITEKPWGVELKYYTGRTAVEFNFLNDEWDLFRDYVNTPLERDMDCLAEAEAAND